MDSRYKIGDKVIIHHNPCKPYVGLVKPIAKDYIKRELVFTISDIIPKSVFKSSYYLYELKEDRRRIYWIEYHLFPFIENKNFIDLSVLV